MDNNNDVWQVIGYKPYVDEQGSNKMRICCVRDNADPMFIGIETRSFSVDQICIISANGAKLAVDSKIKFYTNKNNYCIRVDILDAVNS